MKLLLFTLLIIGVSLAYGDECARGQAYWCTSLKAAKSCGAIQHCIDNVWSEQTPYAQDNGDVCKFCEDVITDVRNFFNKNNEAKVQQYLDSACGMIPVPELSDRCKDYVKNDLDELYQLIRSKLNPKAICSAIRLCTGFKDLTHVSIGGSNSLTIIKAIQDAPAKTTTAAPDVCKDCEKLVNDMKALLTNQKTEEQLETYFKQNLCQQLGPAQDECNSLVHQYVPELMTLVQEEVDAKLICGSLGFCAGGDKSILPRMRLRNSPLFKAASKMRATAECDACKVILSELQNLDRNQVLQEDLENALKTKLCPALGSLKEECIQTVEQYGQFLFEFLANELDPNTRCQSLGFCATDNSVKISATRQATPLLKATPKANNLKQSVQCVICEFVMDKLDGILAQNASQTEIVNALDKICSILPDTIKEECDSFIKMYGPAIIDLLAQELSPQLMCTTLGLCKGNTVKSSSQVLFKQNKISSSKTDCGTCETVVQYIDSLLEENSSVKAIEDVIDKICNFMPGNLKTECYDFVKQYGPQMIQLIAELADPQKICQDLGLCPTKQKLPTSTMELIRPAKQHLVGENECTFGPSYWCSKRENAQKCGAVAHCEKHGWLN